jgi:predicted enzyme related to lactoylglutathione lyase
VTWRHPPAFTLSGWGWPARPAHRPARWLGWGVALWLKAEDVDRLHDDLARHGVTIVTAPFDGPFGRTFAFADPDGYIITLHG